MTSHILPVVTEKNGLAWLDHERLLDCIHCGLCLSQCPTYAEEGLEADSPRGRVYLMRALKEGHTQPTPELVEHLDLCLGCRACETACPSGVQYGGLIEGARAYLREEYPRPWKQRALGRVIEAVFPHPGRLDLALTPVKIGRRLGVIPLLHKFGFMKMLGYIGEMETMLPPLAPTQKRLAFPDTWQAQGEQQARVGMITGCVMPVMLLNVNIATAKVLNRAGCAVEAPKTQGCCGALHAHTGGMLQAQEFAKRNIEAFEEVEKNSGELEAIIINAAGCGASLKEYGHWFHGDAQWQSRAERFSAKVKDVSEWLDQEPYKSRLQNLMSDASSTRLSFDKAQNDAPLNDIARETLPNTLGANTLRGGEMPRDDANLEQAQDTQSATVDVSNRQSSIEDRQSQMTYHDACHLAHGQGIRAQPRDLMKLCGETLAPLEESEMCCGSAGIYNITQPQMAMQLLERKMKHIKNTGAKIVVTGNPGCMMQLMLGAKKFGVSVEIKHPVEVLEKATRRKSSTRKASHNGKPHTKTD
jgi:Fe-S oxidoreductase